MPPNLANRPMQVAGFSFADGGGGAARAAWRLHTSLRFLGVDAHLHVLRKTSDDASIHPVGRQAISGDWASELAPRIDQLPIRIMYPAADGFWSTGWYGAVDPMRLPGVRDADVVCLYWVARGLLGIRQVGQLLSTNKPVVWRLSDMWPFTGGCHYSRGCDRFESNCGACPQLGSKRDNDLSRWLHQSRMKRWSSGNLTIVSPSRWMASKAKSSSLFHDRSIRVIPTGVDCGRFRRFDRHAARELLKLPQDKSLILYGATSAFSDPRKGGDTVVRLLSRMASEAKSMSLSPGLVVFGTSQRPEGIPESIPVYPLGVISDEALLAMVYSACDVFIAPSREENLANSVLEAMACGLPSMAFNVGGMPDAIAHGENGLLFEAGNDDGFAHGLLSLLGDASLLREFSASARTRAEARFSLEQQARSYKALYSELLQ